MFETRITRLLGIKYPIIQGGLIWLANAELAAAVSNAGGLGMITAGSYLDKEELRAELRKAKSLTDKPVGVNITLEPARRRRPVEQYIDVVIEEGIKIVETSGYSPEPYMKRLKGAGIKVIHKAAGAVRFARTAEAIGCDAVSIIGYECGGHPGMDDTSTLVLVRAALEAVKIPVIAGGGFADAAGFAAALALGADGVLMGTRFMATQESPVHPRFKEWLLRAQETDVVVTQRSIGAPARVLKNELALRVLEMEKQGAALEELLPLISGENKQHAYFDGELEAGVVECGQVVGLIHDMPTVKELVERIVGGAREIIRNRLCPLAD